jgi:single-strand DNA-binding protein
MSLPEVTIEGRLTEDPTLQFSQGGMPIAKLNIAANSRKRVGEEWVDDKVLFLRVTCFRTLAENICESLTKGDLVIASGRLQTDQWETPEGEKRSMTVMVANTVGPSLMFRSAQLGGGAQRAQDASQGGGATPVGQPSNPAGSAPQWPVAPGQSDPPF